MDRASSMAEAASRAYDVRRLLFVILLHMCHQRPAFPPAFGFFASSTVVREFVAAITFSESKRMLGVVIEKQRKGRDDKRAHMSRRCEVKSERNNNKKSHIRWVGEVHRASNLTTSFFETKFDTSKKCFVLHAKDYIRSTRCTTLESM